MKYLLVTIFVVLAISSCFADTLEQRQVTALTGIDKIAITNEQSIDDLYSGANTKIALLVSKAVFGRDVKNLSKNVDDILVDLKKNALKGQDLVEPSIISIFLGFIDSAPFGKIAKDINSVLHSYVENVVRNTTENIQQQIKDITEPKYPDLVSTDISIDDVFADNSILLYAFYKKYKSLLVNTIAKIVTHV